MSDNYLQIVLSFGIYSRRRTLRNNDGNKTKEINSSAFPTEVFYYGMDQADAVQQNIQTESTRSNKTRKSDVSVVFQNENTQTQRIVEAVSAIGGTNRVDEIEENDNNWEESDTMNWVRRSTRKTKKVVQVVKKVSERALKKAYKSAGRSKTTKSAQIEFWRVTLAEASDWASAICERKNISKGRFEHFLQRCLNVLIKTLTKFAVRSSEVHILMMRFGSELAKFLDIAFLTEMTNIQSNFLHMIVQTLSKFMKCPSFMNQTSSVWIQTKEFLKLIISGIRRRALLFSLQRSLIESQTYFMDRATSSEDYHSHVSYVISQLADFNNILSNRLLQVSEQKVFGIAF